MSGNSKKFGVYAQLVSAVLVLSISMAGCKDDPPSGAVSSETPSVEITYLMGNFEELVPVGMDTFPPHQVMEGSPGYFYVFDDPKGEEDVIQPDEKNPDPTKRTYLYPDGFKDSNDFEYYGNTTSVRIEGLSAGNGVGLGTYFEDGEEVIPGYVDTEDGGYVTVPPVKTKVPRMFSTYGQEGLVFWAKGTGTLKVSLNMPGVVDKSLGGECDEEAGDKCFDFHAVLVPVDGKWREYTISWDKFRQGGWGKAVPFSQDEFVAVQFTVDPAGPNGGEFDIWLDMIGFYGGEAWPFMVNYPGVTDTENGPIIPEDSEEDTGTGAEDTGTGVEDTATDTGTDTDTATN